jgi:hypothetical protein
MLTSWSPLNSDAPRAVQVLRHPTATFIAIMQGSATDGVDLSAYVTNCKHTSKDADVSFRYHTALNGTAQPAVGELLELRLNGQFLWCGIIDSISSYRLQAGEHSLAVKAYTRDNMPSWKDVQRVTDLYATGTPIGAIAGDIAAALGLEVPEINLPYFGTYTVHSNMQLANLSAYDMLVTLFLGSGYEPYVDAYGRLRAISRDLGRPSDLVVTEDRVVSIDGSKARSAVTAVRVKWLDPALTLVAQQDQALTQATVTAGFFQLKQVQEIYFSDDRTQRAQGTYMVVKQSANSGLLPVCTERYTPLTPTSGRIDLDTAFWAPMLAIDGIAGMIAASYIPDDVAAFGGGVTIPVGRLVEMVAQVGVMLVMMSIGTGMYEIRGQPYDYVHARNTSEATAAGVPIWLQQYDDIENDFIMNEPQAQACAGRELIYRARSATTYKATIVDDPRIERGDIVELFDGSRVYVLDYSRELSPGSASTLEITGFRA